MLPPWAVFRYLSQSLRRFWLYDISTFNISTNGKQDVLKQPEAKTDLLYFSALSYYKCSVEKNFPISAIAFSHYDYRANMSCKSARNLPKSCVLAMQLNHTNHNDARPILFHLKSSLSFSLFLFVWRLESTTTKSLLRHLHFRGASLFRSRRYKLCSKWRDNTDAFVALQLGQLCIQTNR